MSIGQLVEQVGLIQQAMAAVMQKDVHYGIIPGTSRKDPKTGEELARPTLLKPGAEILCMLFRLAPSYNVVRTSLPGEHREVEIICTLTHQITGRVWGQGVGSCSSMESKYRYRSGSRKCPECGMETIIKDKYSHVGGWLCWKKRGGCDAKFKDGDPAIEGQEIGKIDNPDIADVWNTILKMAKKRAQVDAVLTATAASSMFGQDLEDIAENEEAAKKRHEPAASRPRAQGPPAQAEHDTNIAPSAESAPNGAEIEVAGTVIDWRQEMAKGKKAGTPVYWFTMKPEEGKGEPVELSTFSETFAKLAGDAKENGTPMLAHYVTRTAGGRTFNKLVKIVNDEDVNF